MKTILLAVSVLSPLSTTAQGEMPPRSNTIILYRIGSQEQAWRTVAERLTANGFAIKNSSKDLLTLTTEPKDIGRGQRIYLSASVKDSLVTFTAMQYTPSLGDSRVELKGMQGSPARRTWDAFETAVRSMGGVYRVEKR